MAKSLTQRFFAALILLGFSVPSGAWAQPLPVLDTLRVLDSIRTVRKQKIFDFTDSRWPIGWRMDTLKNIPTELRGENLSIGLTKTDPVEAAYEFLELNKEIFGIKNVREELKVEGITFKKYGGLVVLKQFYNGLPVSGGEIIVRFTPSKVLNAVESRFQPEIDVQLYAGITPSVDSLSAIEFAKKAANFASNRADTLFWKSIGRPVPIPSASLAILPHNGKYELVWSVHLAARRPRRISGEYIINANSGTVLDQHSGIFIHVPESHNPKYPPPDSSPMPLEENTKKPIQNESNGPQKSEVKIVPLFPEDSLKMGQLLPGSSHPNELPDSTVLPTAGSGGRLSPAEIRDAKRDVERVALPSDTTRGSVTGRVMSEEVLKARKERIRQKTWKNPSDSTQGSGVIMREGGRVPPDQIPLKEKEVKKDSSNQESSHPNQAQSSGPLVEIYRTWWSNWVDCDQDFYQSSQRLNWDVDLKVCGTGESLFVYEELYAKPSGYPFYIYQFSTPGHWVYDCAPWDVYSAIANAPDSGSYDFMIQVYRDGEENPDDFRDAFNDGQLWGQLMEPAGQDQCPTATIAGAWWTDEIDCNNNGFISTARLNWDPDLVSPRQSTRFVDSVCNHCASPRNRLSVRYALYYSVADTSRAV